MPRLTNRPLLAALAIACAAPAASAPEVADRIIAVVEDEVITASEIAEQTQLLLLELRMDPESAPNLATLESEVLQQLVDNVLIVKEAERQGIEVTEERIDGIVERQLEQQIERLGGEAAFQEQLAREGVTMRDMQSVYRKDVRRQLLTTQLVELELDQNVEITDEEVRAFFETKKAELPKRPARVRLRHLLIRPKPAAAVEAEARRVLGAARDRIVSGEDFAAVAREVSRDATGARGGDVGFFAREDMDPAFTGAAFALADSAMSDVVRTGYGFHVIQRLATDGERIRARHIVWPHATSAEDVARARDLMQNVVRRLEEGAGFVDLVRAYSDAPEADGDVGYFPIEGLFPNIRSAVDSLDAGEVSRVVEDEQGYHLFQVLDRETASDYTFDEVEAEIRQLVRREKIAGQYNAWIEKLRERSYVEIRQS